MTLQTKQTITAKIIRAGIDLDGQATIEVEFKSRKITWTKSYSYFTTQTIKEADFKARIESDIKKDLKSTDQLKEIEPLIGKSFEFQA
jgi:hypothetical protein